MSAVATDVSHESGGDCTITGEQVRAKFQCRKWYFVIDTIQPKRFRTEAEELLRSPDFRSGHTLLVIAINDKQYKNLQGLLTDAAQTKTLPLDGHHVAVGNVNSVALQEALLTFDHEAAECLELAMKNAKENATVVAVNYGVAEVFTLSEE